MGRLLTESPEEFLWVMNFCSTVVPFVLAGGTIIWIGLRTKRSQSATVCAQCRKALSKTDLGTIAVCPGCGVDLSQANSVVVVPSQRRWGLVGWGTTLLLTPVVVQLALSWLAPTRNPLQLLSNQRLIHNRLPNQVDEPQVPPGGRVLTERSRRALGVLRLPGRTLDSRLPIPSKARLPPCGYGIARPKATAPAKRASRWSINSWNRLQSDGDC